MLDPDALRAEHQKFYDYLLSLHELEAKINEPGAVVANRDREMLALEIRLLTEYLTAVGFLPLPDDASSA